MHKHIFLAADVQVSVTFFVLINLKPGTPAHVPPQFNLTVVLVDGHESKGSGGSPGG